MRRALWVLGGVTVLGAGVWISSTWNSFPGGYIKNRIGLGGGETGARARAAEAERLVVSADGPRTVLVRKSDRLLVVFAGRREIFRTRVGLGGAPVGHKTREGDRRTPESEYYVCTRNAQSRFRLFLGLSYPGLKDADVGLAEGRISREERDRIARAVAECRRPPWDTPLGGAVGIHGSGAAMDWTLGCIALDDPDIELVWNLCPLGTRVVIAP